jgi:hypothetical protein
MAAIDERPGFNEEDFTDGGIGMMTQPSVARLIEVIRTQLTEVVLPVLPDDGPRSTLGMVDHLLQTIQTRSEKEIEWMKLQITDVIGLAERAAARGDVSSTVSDAVDAFKADSMGSLATSEVTADYAKAAAVLSLLLEETVNTPSDTAIEARHLMEREVQWGVDIVGEFVLVAP